MIERSAFVLLIVACRAPSTPASPTQPSAVLAKPALPDVPFAELEHAQKIEFMKQRVVPAMEPIFKRHDAGEFAEFGCVTCHGKRAMEGRFVMPSGELPELDFKDLSNHAKADLEWMANEVKPTMAKLLGEVESSAEHPTGFGCQNCHATE